MEPRAQRGLGELSAHGLGEDPARPLGEVERSVAVLVRVGKATREVVDIVQYQPSLTELLDRLETDRELTRHGVRICS